MMKLKWIGSLLILAGVVGCKTPDRPNLVCESEYWYGS